MPPFGTALPAVQQIPSRVQPWERTLTGPDLLTFARVAESAGFAWLSCSDHPFVPVSRADAMGATWFDAGSTLAYVAGATQRIKLLSHVLVLPYRHPLIVAKQYGTLAYLTGGRVLLGVGSGHLKPEFKVLGADYDRRGLVSDEYLQAIAAAWDNDVAAFDGETVAFKDAMVSPRPEKRPPIWVGGNSKPAARRAARYGDGWVPWELSPDTYAATAAFIAKTRADAGRTGDFTFVAPFTVPADATAAALVDDAARWRAAGATAFHSGFGASSLQHLLDRLAWFGENVIPHVN